jgi:hypothetical protein
LSNKTKGILSVIGAFCLQLVKLIFIIKKYHR